jgi:hypothetical protein
MLEGGETIDQHSNSVLFEKIRIFTKQRGANK